jgi:hypothetical protein
MKHADLIKRLIREVLSTPPKKDKCNCGCHSCENVGNPGPVLNESLNAKIIMTENMKYHVNNKLAITENTFRYGSQAFLDLWAEARYLYSRNAIHVNDLDKEILTETNLGEYGMYNGIKVALDLPMLEEAQMLDSYEVDFFKTKANVYANIEIPSENPTFEDDIQIKGIGQTEEEAFEDLKQNYEKYKKGLYENENELGGKDDVEFTTSIFMVPYLPLLQQIEKDWGKGDIYYEVEQALFDKNINQVRKILKNYEVDKEYAYLLNLNEAEKKKTPALNKPKRGGSKKFYVYVRDPKTKKIKKVSFGAPGMSVGFKDPKRRKAFAARHDCKNKKDRTKPSYWSCNVGRYAKQLGLGSNFYGYW